MITARLLLMPVLRSVESNACAAARDAPAARATRTAPTARSRRAELRRMMDVSFMVISICSSDLRAFPPITNKGLPPSAVPQMYQVHKRDSYPG